MEIKHKASFFVSVRFPWHVNPLQLNVSLRFDLYIIHFHNS